MNPQVLAILEYNKVLELLANHALSGLGRESALKLQPMTQPRAVEAALLETGEARAVLDRGAQVPLWGLADLRPLLERVAKGGVLQAGELIRFADCLRGCRELKQYMRAKRQSAPRLFAYSEGLTALPGIEAEICGAVDGGRAADTASPALAKVRKELRIVEERIKAKLQEYLCSPKLREALQEGFVALRGDRYALPVKASHRRRLSGEVVGTSGSGATVFIEPAAVRRLTESLHSLKSEEQDQEYQVLASLTGLLGEEIDRVGHNLEIMAFFDLTLAKARLSLEMNGVAAELCTGGTIRLAGARHPLLRGEVVPLDLTLDERQRTLVITGPNTGGKTVALKTVGLLALMNQAGLHVPASEGTVLPVFENVLADIGDGQSIEQSLSTFSGHMTRIAAILREAGRGSLVLLDEIGTGTDPGEGAALAIAILEELHAAGATTIASTHYGDVKYLAETRQGFVNGRMDFDRETLRPLFRLVMGEAGQSQALWIAERLGIGPAVINRARNHLLRAAPGRADSRAARTAGGQAGGGRGERTAASGGRAATARRDGPSPDPSRPHTKPQRAWRLGDSVGIPATGRQGVVASLPDEKGRLVVFSGGERIRVHERRVRLVAPAEELYPEGYDLRTVLFTWKERKLMHDMQRKGDQVLDASRDYRWVLTGPIEVDRSTPEEPGGRSS